MQYKARKKAIILLADGTIFYGKAIGKEGSAFGEVCFNTGMTGYQEIITDPSYHGQLVTMTYPHIGNYGVNEEDIESNKIQCSGLVIKEETIIPSNFRATSSLGQYLSKNKVFDYETRHPHLESYPNPLFQNQKSSFPAHCKFWECQDYINQIHIFL